MTRAVFTPISGSQATDTMGVAVRSVGRPSIHHGARRSGPSPFSPISVRRGHTWLAGNTRGRERCLNFVRGLVVAVVGSVLVHGLALAWLTSRRFEVPAPAAEVELEVEPPPPAPVATIDPPPLEVVLLDGASNGGGGVVVAAASGSDVAPAKRGRLTKRGATGETGASETATPTRSPYLTMRRPGDDGMQGPSGDFLADFLNRSKPLPPPPDIPGEAVGNQIADVRARLKRAGRYSPEELGAMREQLVALDAQREAEELKPAGGGRYKSEKETFRAHVNPDGSVKLEDKPENMDSQDKLMKRHGIDPYGRNKLAYLDRTRDQRVAIGKRYREEQLGKSVVYMQQHIARLWAMTTDVAKRKQGLFELWDECIETGTPEEVAGGAAARAFVMAHIRAKVRYTPDELRALNAQRHSTQPFAP